MDGRLARLERETQRSRDPAEPGTCGGQGYSLWDDPSRHVYMRQRHRQAITPPGHATDVRGAPHAVPRAKSTCQTPHSVGQCHRVSSRVKTERYCFVKLYDICALRSAVSCKPREAVLYPDSVARGPRGAPTRGYAYMSVYGRIASARLTCSERARARGDATRQPTPPSVPAVGKTWPGLSYEPTPLSRGAQREAAA